MARRPLRPAATAGDVHQARLDERGERRARGAYYTPPELISGVLDLALDPLLERAAAAGPDAVLALRIIDPSCGDGRFLAAAGERLVAALVAAGTPADEAAALVAGRCLHGVDLDPEAVDLARGSLRSFGAAPDAARIAVVRGDALLEVELVPEGSFDLVVGNPPFLSQLDAGTARSAESTARLRARFGGAIAAYTGPAAAFLLLGRALARPDGGVVALVEPVPLLSARDAAGTRAALLDDGHLRSLWLVGDAGFDADVEVCVPVLERSVSVDRRRPGSTSLHRGRSGDDAGAAPAPTPADPSWSGLLATIDGLPDRSLDAVGTLADLATATADFRDQYYGLAGCIVDEPDADDATHPPLVTVGLIDPAQLGWGERPTRFNKVSYLHPRVDRAALPEPLVRWVDARLVPKVLLATQTRVLEAVVDPVGRLLPSVPVVSVIPNDPVDAMAVWRIGAVLTCPAVALVAARRHLGTGRSARSLRLRAAEVLELPTPADRVAWDAAAEALSAGAPVAEVGAAMDAAYGLPGDDALLAWWLDLLPSRRRT